jgi:hypothetical protein
MSKRIEIGRTADQKAVELDVAVFLRTRMLVQAASGQGKSHWLRRLCEQLYGVVQIFVIDHEGEFASLRKNTDYDFVVAGEGGDTALDIRSAALLANRLLELNASTVFDLSESFRKHPGDRKAWVRMFLSALMETPKSLWHPLVVIVDEAHKFAPESGDSEALDAMISLATDGRKRQFCAVYATQRLGKLSKDAASELLNVMIGGTVLDLDRKRAADALGVYGKDLRAFNDEIKTIERGSFWCLGPAIAKERILCKVGPTVTVPPKVGSAAAFAPPPPSTKIKAMLPKLEDLPKASAEKAATEAELRKQIQTLKHEVRKLGGAKQSVVIIDEAHKLAPAPALSIDQVVAAIAPAFDNIRDRINPVVARLVEALEIDRSLIAKVAKALNTARATATPAVPSKTRRGDPPATTWTATEPYFHRDKVQTLRGDVREIETPDGVTRPQAKILRSLAELEAAEQTKPSREAVAFWSSASPTSSSFEKNVSSLKTSGLVDYPDRGHLTLTAEGRALAGTVEAPSAQGIYERGAAILTNPQRKLFEAIYRDYPRAQLSREELANVTGTHVKSSSFEKNVSRLRTAGLIEYPSRGIVRASDWLFLQ